jgi:hypothetical protein
MLLLLLTYAPLLMHAVLPGLVDRAPAMVLLPPLVAPASLMPYALPVMRPPLSICRAVR